MGGRRWVSQPIYGKYALYNIDGKNYEQPQEQLRTVKVNPVMPGRSQKKKIWLFEII